jgi:hypothetical protein
MEHKAGATHTVHPTKQEENKRRSPMLTLWGGLPTRSRLDQVSSWFRVGFVYSIRARVQLERAKSS